MPKGKKQEYLELNSFLRSVGISEDNFKEFDRNHPETPVFFRGNPRELLCDPIPVLDYFAKWGLEFDIVQATDLYHYFGG